MTNKTIHPTGTCFDDALGLMMAILKENETSPRRTQIRLRERLYLVHGVTMILGKPSAHAWVEYDHTGQVLFVGILDGKRENLAAPREEYYRELKVTATTRYLYRDMFRLNRATGHHGPWEERYKRLCKDTAVMTDYKIDKIAPLEPEC